MNDNNLIDKRDDAIEEMVNTINNGLYRKILEDARKNFGDKISKRQEYNYKCLDVLKELIDKYPDWRFTQIIFNVGLAEDRFYQESVDTYELMKMAIKMSGI